MCSCASLCVLPTREMTVLYTGQNTIFNIVGAVLFNATINALDLLNWSNVQYETTNNPLHTLVSFSGECLMDSKVAKA